MCEPQVEFIRVLFIIFTVYLQNIYKHTFYGEVRLATASNRQSLTEGFYRWRCNSVSGQGIPIPHCSREERLPVRFSSGVRHLILIGMWLGVPGCLCGLHDVVLCRKMSKIVVNLIHHG